MPATKRPEHDHEAQHAHGGRPDPADPRRQALTKRLHRIEGQVRGITRMVEEGRYCVDILTQLSAIRSALDAVAMQLIEDHTHGCVQSAVKSGEGEAAIRELMAVLKQYVR